jgi:hypothetical protein
MSGSSVFTILQAKRSAQNCYQSGPIMHLLILCLTFQSSTSCCVLEHYAQASSLRRQLEGGHKLESSVRTRKIVVSENANDGGPFLIAPLISTNAGTMLAMTLMPTSPTGAGAAGPNSSDGSDLGGNPKRPDVWGWTSPVGTQMGVCRRPGCEGGCSDEIGSELVNGMKGVVGCE